MRSVVLVLVVVLTLAGCLGAKQQDPPTPVRTEKFTDNATASTNANTSANATTNSTNSTQQYDYSNCMVGMDMPGCPAAVAERYYKEQAAKQKPDRALPPVKIILSPKGDGQAGKFSVENGTQQLIVTLLLNDSGAGPYVALGPGGMGDLNVIVKGASGSDTFQMTGSGNSAGVDPVQPLGRSYNGIVKAPSEGDWSVTVGGQGQNVEVTLNIVERFYS